MPSAAITNTSIAFIPIHSKNKNGVRSPQTSICLVIKTFIEESQWEIKPKGEKEKSNEPERSFLLKLMHYNFYTYTYQYVQKREDDSSCSSCETNIAEAIELLVNWDSYNIP